MASIFRTKEYQSQTDAGAPLNGGKLYFYVTTTTTLKDTFPTEADANAGTNANANPVTLDSDGRCATEIWISGRYRVITKTSAGVTIADDDPIEDTVSASTAQQQAHGFGGNNSGTANALVFTYSPAITAYANGTPLRGRILADNSTAVTVNAGGGIKSLVKRDGTAMLSGDLQGPDIIEFAYDSTTDVMRLMSPDGYLARDGNNAPARADVVAAATVNLDTAATRYVRITGSTGITAITLSDGRVRDLVFSGSPTITNGASLITGTGATVQATAGTVARVVGEAAGVVRFLTPLGTRPVKRTVLTGSGTFTPVAGANRARVRMVGPGSGGSRDAAGAATSGGAGAAQELEFFLTVATYAYVIGAGGVGRTGSAGAGAASANDTTLTSSGDAGAALTLLVAKGAAPAASSGSNNGGAGGATITATGTSVIASTQLAIPGQKGGNNNAGAEAGGSPGLGFGFGGQFTDAGATGNAAIGFGGGGCGGGGAGQNGGDGAAGSIVIDEFM